MKPRTWQQALAFCEQQGCAYVIATIIGRAGSAPRDPGSKMIITADEQFDTLGGGELEFLLSQKARQLLLQNTSTQSLEMIPLAAQAGQCCGGSVSVLLESFCAQRPVLAVFGAGHVARALMTIVQHLPIQVHWIDSREEQFKLAHSLEFPRQSTLNSNIKILVSDDPVASLNALPSGAQLVILTHNHQLDFDLLVAALTRGDCSFVGCIGSDTKQARFTQRLRHQGFSPEQIATVTMPIGHADILGKLPMEVAVSISAQLIALHHGQQDRSLHQGISAKELRANEHWMALRKSTTSTNPTTEISTLPLAVTAGPFYEE